jgi:hypothetical protein
MMVVPIMKEIKETQKNKIFLFGSNLVVKYEIRRGTTILNKIGLKFKRKQ